MATISIDAIFLKHFVIAHGNGELKEEEWLLFSSFLPKEGTHLIKVQFLKERGNDFFRQNMFDSAGGCYEMACRILCVFLESTEGYDVKSVLQLAISLNLNLAACANKLHEYEAAINFCSLVLSSFPKNAKALFRRAIACMKTNMLLEAQTDLETAAMLEPRNKDILREINVVHNLRAINHNGKRSIDDQLLCEVARESKRPIPNVNVENIRDTSVNDMDRSSCGSCITPSFDSMVKDICISENIIPVNLDENASPNKELEDNHKEVKMGENEHIPNSSVFEFSKKNGGNSRLRISGQDYQKILRGSTVSYYHRDMSIMTIRILNIGVVKEGGTTRVHDKRKKKRRRSKKRKFKTRVVNEDSSSPSSGINGSHDIMSREPSLGGVSSMSSSVCDNFSCAGIHNFQGNSMGVDSNTSLPLSLVNDTANFSNCPQAHKDSNEHELFLFSACSKESKSASVDKVSRASTTRRFCRYPSNRQESEKRRINNFKKKHSQGNESPRHNVSTSCVSRSFSRKSLRPRGVSVSCCRYAPEAQLTKKRKEVSTQLSSSDRPLKKSFLFHNPILSLISFADNVKIKSDSENRIGTV